jgi:hypothetical protein
MSVKEKGILWKRNGMGKSLRETLGRYEHGNIDLVRV